MLTLVHIRNARGSSSEAATLVADYLAFDKRRTARRQYLKAFGGMAVVVAIGALLGRVPAGEAEVVAGLLLLPPLVLAGVELVLWRRLTWRLNRVRAELRSVESRKKVVSTEGDLASGI